MTEAVIDIRFGEDGPAGTLSNFTAHAFSVDDVPCASMEGFLQSLKFSNPHDAATARNLCGTEAKAFGLQAPDWRPSQTLFWQNRELSRNSSDYASLITRAFDAMFVANAGFRAALAATGDARLVHTIGVVDAHETVLTDTEFCDALMRCRARLAREAA